MVIIGISLCNLCIVFMQDEIVHTLRSALFRFEQQIPLCFMHSKWEQYRKMWGRMLLKNDSSRAFAVVLGILEMAIRDNVKKNVWKESMGQSRYEVPCLELCGLFYSVVKSKNPF